MATKTARILEKSLVERRDGQGLYFSQVSKGNRSGSNLTELNATDALDTGFMSHNDWVAHGIRYGFVADVIRKLKPDSVLDVGCGRFPLLNYLWKNRSAEQFMYTGLDLRANRKWLEHLRWKKGPVHLVQMDLVLDSVEIEPADLVISTEVFEHVPADKQPLFMQRLYGWTKRGGTCIFSTPNAGVSKSTADNHKDDQGRSREMRYKDKIRLAESVGFSIQATYGTFIAKSRIPDTFWNETTIAAERYLPNAFFTCLAAAGFPEQSNNSLFVMTR